MMVFIRGLLFISAILMTFGILLQQRGSGLSGTFGGTGNVYTSKRGAEKIIFFFTVVMAVLFVGSAIALPFLS